jgi:hypothetical protein
MRVIHDLIKVVKGSKAPFLQRQNKNQFSSIFQMFPTGEKRFWQAAKGMWTKSPDYYPKK